MYSIDEILSGEIEETGQENVNFDKSDNEIESENENNERNDSEEVKKDVKDDESDDKKVKKTRKQFKRVVLNAETLKTNRGLVCMEKTYEKLKFKGNGYEEQDLETVMNSLQHWCHRLFPKFTFDDTLEQLERLGTKKTVMVLRKKIILNMIEEINNVENEDENVNNDEIPEKIDDFDLLLNENRTQIREKSPELEITEEQLQIMEKNRILAAERRRKRLAQENIEVTEKQNENYGIMENLRTENDKDENFEIMEQENLETTEKQNENLEIENLNENLRTENEKMEQENFEKIEKQHKNLGITENLNENLGTEDEIFELMEQENLDSKNLETDEDRNEKNFDENAVSLEEIVAMVE